jgi:hypothetical protein
MGHSELEGRIMRSAIATTLAVSARPRRYYSADDASGYWTAGQVQDHFGGVSDMWIRRHQKAQGFPPAIKFGGPTSTRFFKIADVLAWEREWIRLAQQQVNSEVAKSRPTAEAQQ